LSLRSKSTCLIVYSSKKYFSAKRSGSSWSYNHDLDMKIFEKQYRKNNPGKTIRSNLFYKECMTEKVKVVKSPFPKIWKHLEPFSDYCFLQDNTLHTFENCNFFQKIPIVSEDNQDLLCGNCFASLDIQWRKRMNVYNFKRFQNIHELWECLHFDSYVQFVPKEVLLDILAL